MEPTRYVFRLLGDMGRIVATRYHISYQSIGRLAALVVPDAVMLRLVRETGGNLVGVLGPIEAALKDAGYTHFMVVPADVRVVELVPVEPGVHGGLPAVVESFADQTIAAATLLREAADALGDRPETEPLRHRIAALLVRLG